ncbi:MAG TPA: futalosine hydrolase [Nitrospirota bacterium]|nr:futalosine hydrolase [Nitrospirota bacterium]
MPGVKYSMIALICAVQAEASLLLEETVVSSTVAHGSKTVIEGMLHNQHVLLCVGGMGKVNASHAATLLFTGFSPEAVVVFGVGGAYPASGAKVGDVALAIEEVAGDEGVLTREGFKDVEYIKTGKVAIFSTYPASGPLVRRSLQLLTSRQGTGDHRVHAGTFVTLSTCTGTDERARELETRYHGLCENMEGAAVAQVAGLHGIPWIEVRGISNLVEDRDLRKWDIPRAAEAAQAAVLQILEGWNG